MNNYKNMSNEEIKRQLEWSDQYEFSYGYSMWAFKEIERLNNIINKIRKWLEEDYKSTIDNEVCDYPRYYLDKFDEIVGSDKE